MRKTENGLYAQNIAITENYQTWIEQAFENAQKKGFRDQKPSITHCLALIVTELSEAIEADRKGRFVTVADLETYKGLQNPNRFYAKFLKNTFPDEIADTAIRVFDLCGATGLTLFTPISAIENSIHELKNLTTIDQIYSIQSIIFRTNPLCSKLNLIICNLIAIAILHGFDMGFFITEKMKYNTDREHKHGKLY